MSTDDTWTQVQADLNELTDRLRKLVGSVRRGTGSNLDFEHLTRTAAAVAGELRKLEPGTSTLEKLSAVTPPEQPPGAVHDEATSLRLALLRALLDMDRPILEPEPYARAPLGHRCEEADLLLGVGPGESLAVLEDLADLGLLARELANVLHACPRCSWCQLNFRETCPRCDSFDVRVDRLLHHFHCGYAGLEPEFVQGIELVCPKCRVRLNQLGQDFERPHDTYVCNACDSFFEEPSLEAQCLNCELVSPSGEVEIARVHRYLPSPLTIRAVEQSRLTGLDVSSVMYDANVLLCTRDWLVMQAQRELLRLRRYKSPFSTVRLSFDIDGKPFPVLREWGTRPIRTLASLLSGSLRPLDIVSRLDNARLGLLLVEADADGSAAVEARIGSQLAELDLRTRGGRALQVSWVVRSWTDAETRLEDIEAFLDEDLHGERAA